MRRTIPFLVLVACTFAFAFANLVALDYFTGWSQQQRYIEAALAGFAFGFVGIQFVFHAIRRQTGNRYYPFKPPW